MNSEITKYLVIYYRDIVRSSKRKTTFPLTYHNEIKVISVVYSYVYFSWDRYQEAGKGGRSH